MGTAQLAASELAVTPSWVTNPKHRDSSSTKRSAGQEFDVAMSAFTSRILVQKHALCLLTSSVPVI